jgi:predicted lactoylglutathione lyase
MKLAPLSLLRIITIILALSADTIAKDKEIALTTAPAGVQATIKKVTDAGAILEKVEKEEESGGTQYGAKITDKNGLRWEIIMTADGTVVKTSQKKPKK